MNGEEARIRYSRLAAIPEIGKEGMERLRRARVLIAGCGALGSMAAMQLAGSGVGKLRLVDFDTVDLSNLQRQFFFKTSETGRGKAVVLSERIKDLNPDVEVETVEGMFSSASASSLLSGCDFIVEATDNPSSMSAVDISCEEAGVGCVLAGVSGFTGQVMTCIPGGRRYRDIFPETEEGGILPCSLGGVAGPAAAVAASIEASETIKALLNLEPLLSKTLLTFDLLNLRFNLFDT